MRDRVEALRDIGIDHLSLSHGPPAHVRLPRHPRQVNEFLWETTTPSHFLAKLAADADCGVIPGRRTGIHWSRRFAR